MSIRNGIILLALLLGLELQPAIPTHAAQRCFSETNQCIDGRIREFWEQNGGLAIFGFPIGSEEQSTVDGKTFTVQRFERNRLIINNLVDYALGVEVGLDSNGRKNRGGTTMELLIENYIQRTYVRLRLVKWCKFMVSSVRRFNSIGWTLRGRHPLIFW
jgi:hypothetical protein